MLADDLETVSGGTERKRSPVQPLARREGNLLKWLNALVGLRTIAKRWMLAAAFFAASLAARLVLDRWLHQIPFLTFFPALVAAALLCGWPQGTAVLAASAVAAYYLFLPSSPLSVLGGVVPILGFLAVGAGIVVLVSALAELVRRLDAATRTRDALQEEMQHRVANNMQLVASMLMQARRVVSDGETAEILDQAAARITSLSVLHRRLADRTAYAHGLEPILGDLLASVFQGVPVQIVIDIRQRNLPIDQMTSIVLLASEAATNAVKHVFRAERGTLFKVSLSPVQGGRLRLVIRDDGPGLGPVTPGSPQSQGLGMRIMQALAAQLGGTLALAEGPGTAFQVEFPVRQATA